MADEMRITHPREQRNASRRAAELAVRQFGCIARRQLLDAGLSEGGIRSWLHLGRLHARYPGVYAFGRADLPIEGQLGAALLLAGPGSALAGITALWWTGLLTRRPASIHVDAPGRTSSRRDVVIRHPRAVARERHQGLPVVPLPSALLRTSPDLTTDTLRLVLARAEFNHQLDLSALRAALAPGPRGAAAVQAAMDAHLPQLARCANGFERDFVLLCERYGLPIPEPNARIGRFRPDMLWRSAGLIVELDGQDAHRTVAQLASDRRRQAELENRGFTVIRFTWADVNYDAMRVVAELRRLLA